MAMDWFRSWHNAPTDPKWLIVARKAKTPPGMVSAVFWALLDHASQEKERGCVAGFDVETYAGWAGWDENEVQAIIDAMRSKGVITEDNRLASWEKRQPKQEDPGAADRMRKMRDAKREAERLAFAMQSNSVTEESVTDSYGMLQGVTTDEIRREEIRIDERVTKSDGVLRDVTQPPTYSPGFDDFERNFRLNLLTSVKERDPQQSLAGGFSLSDASKAMLLQVQNSGPLLTAKAIDWALDQWEAAKPAEKFRVQDKGCVNWLLTVISNSYKPNHVNGTGAAKDPDNRPRVAAPPAAEVEAADARQAEYERKVAEQLARAGRLA